MMNFFQQIIGEAGGPAVQQPLLIILDGQSNNGGQGEIADLPGYLTGQISANLKIWDGTNTSILEAGVNNNGQMLLSAGGAWISTWHGSELSLGYALNQEYTDRQIYFVKTGQGGRPLGEDAGTEDFSPDSVGELHQYMLDNVSDFLTNESKTINQFDVWYVWMQGEYDCRTGQDSKASAYGVNLENKIDAVKQDLNKQDIHTIIDVINSTIDRDEDLIPLVRSAQINYGQETGDAEYQLSETWPLKVDDLHFNSEGQVLKGEGEASIIINN